MAAGVSAGPSPSEPRRARSSPSRSRASRTASRTRWRWCRASPISASKVDDETCPVRVARPRPRPDAGVRSASASTASRARSSSSSARRSSSTSKRAGTLASKGNRWSRRSQKAWMVWIFSPPGVSTVRAKSRRASSSAAGPPARAGTGAPVSRIAPRRPSSSRRVQAARSRNTRIDMLAAAALVKVRHRMRDGATPASSSRSTRWASTCVLPDPALADTQAEVPGWEARRWRSMVSVGTAGAASATMDPSPPARGRAESAAHGSAPSPVPPVADHSFTRARWS